MRRTLAAAGLIVALATGCSGDDTDAAGGSPTTAPSDGETTTTTGESGGGGDDVIVAAGSRVAEITAGTSAESPTVDPTGPCPIMGFETLAGILGSGEPSETDIAELDRTLRCILRYDDGRIVSFQVTTDMGTIDRYREVPLSEDVEPDSVAGGELSAFCGNPDECYAFWTAPDGTWNLYLSIDADAKTNAATLDDYLGELLAAVAAG